jgi:hypothetical protein
MEMSTPGNNENVKRSKPGAMLSGNASKSTTASLASHSRQVTRKSSGPRTASGKRRSRYNALKSGLFAKGLLLKGESRAEFDLLFTGCLEHFRPEGAFETEFIRDVAWNRWRKRRLCRAETALIEEATTFKTLDCISAQSVEAWDKSRAGETSGGMLRDNSNPYVIGQAIDILKTFRDCFEKHGFKTERGLLMKLYGLDHNNAVPVGLYHTFVDSKLAAEVPKAGESSNSPDQLKKKMLGLLDSEMERLGALLEFRSGLNLLRAEYQTTAALLLPQGDLERIIRSEAHLGRDLDRTLSQYERCQKIRLGQPTPPTIRLDISRE